MPTISNFPSLISGSCKAAGWESSSTGFSQARSIWQTSSRSLFPLVSLLSVRPPHHAKASPAFRGSPGSAGLPTLKPTKPSRRQGTGFVRQGRVVLPKSTGKPLIPSRLRPCEQRVGPATPNASEVRREADEELPRDVVEIDRVTRVAGPGGGRRWRSRRTSGHPEGC